jgi:hypothetical protein
MSGALCDAHGCKRGGEDEAQSNSDPFHGDLLLYAKL